MRNSGAMPDALPFPDGLPVHGFRVVIMTFVSLDVSQLAPDHVHAVLISQVTEYRLDGHKLPAGLGVVSRVLGQHCGAEQAIVAPQSSPLSLRSARPVPVS